MTTPTARPAARRSSTRSAAQASGIAAHTYASVSVTGARSTSAVHSATSAATQVRRAAGPHRSPAARPTPYTSASSVLSTTMSRHSGSLSAAARTRPATTTSANAPCARWSRDRRGVGGRRSDTGTP
ncbi:hypothetical protein [Streptomyces sp. ST1015]|uniref:hypothetical protein n=1 Tax=Streptomyces sp. ST1015 TaxID=1848900 RepID=UPI00223C435C|nr:hypothetical protein [Streptomyces sp. ST1015]